jgi:hypothetical protein
VLAGRRRGFPQVARKAGVGTSDDLLKQGDETVEQPLHCAPRQ